MLVIKLNECLILNHLAIPVLPGNTLDTEVSHCAQLNTLRRV